MSAADAGDRPPGEPVASGVTVPGRIVVGIDGSQVPDEALRWAYEEARLRHATLDVVHAWALPAVGDPVGMAAADPMKFKRAAAHRLSAVIDLTLDENRDVEVSEHLVNGDATSALLSRSAGADLLVVGSRGQGGFVGLLLGSVSQKCATHANCPVVIVRPIPSSTQQQV